MKIVSRYILTELLLPFLVGVVLLTSILLLVDLLELTELVVNKGVPLLDVLAGVLMQIPQTFTLSVPMSLVMSVIMTYGRLSQDNELLVLRSAGYPLRSLCAPPLALALVLSVGLLTAHQYGLPQLKNFRASWIQQLRITNPVNLLHPKTYLEIPPYTLYAEEVDGWRMQDVYLEDRREENARIIFSNRGQWFKQPDGQFGLRLKNGTLHQKIPDGGYRVLQFRQQVIEFKPRRDNAPSDPERHPTLLDRYRNLQEREKRITSLQKKLDRAQENGDGGTAESLGKKLDRARRKYAESGTQFHRILAISFASFFLVLVTLPAGILTRLSGKTLSFLSSLGIIVVYYLMLTLAEPLGEFGWVPPWLAMWSGNVLFGLAGVVLLTVGLKDI